jgi:CheY-like chemotaxis protein
MPEQLFNFIGVLIWPAVLVFAFVFFRKSLRRLMERDDLSVKAPGGFELSATRRDQAADALIKATDTKGGPPMGSTEMLDRVDDAARTIHDFGTRARVLWVDDRPSNNRYERTAMEALGIGIELSMSTDEAVDKIRRSRPYDLIISDLNRPPDSHAGYELLAKLRTAGDRTPCIIYAGSRSAEDFDEAVRHGAEGCTNSPQELIDMVLAVLRRQRAS